MNRHGINQVIWQMAAAMLICICCTPVFASAGQRKLSRSECTSDIDSLIYTLVEVHPDLFAQVGISDFMDCAESVKANLYDSLSVVDFYERIAPLVAMIGDAHTTMNPPGEEILERTPLMLPFLVRVDGEDGMLTVVESNAIPAGSRLLSVNGAPANDMVDRMLGYISVSKNSTGLLGWLTTSHGCFRCDMALIDM